MSKKGTSKTKIEVSTSVRDKLRVLRVALGKGDYDELLEDMIMTYIKAKKIKIVIKVGEESN